MNNTSHLEPKFQSNVESWKAALGLGLVWLVPFALVVTAAFFRGRIGK
jgi:hypothetical protein